MRGGFVNLGLNSDRRQMARAVLEEHTGKLVALETQRKTLGDEKAATRAKNFADEWIKAHTVNGSKPEATEPKSAS